jgi:hypothetical protein
VSAIFQLLELATFSHGACPFSMMR